MTLLLRWIVVCVWSLFPVIGQAATYYVATTGNDSNIGSAGSPYLTIARCTRAPTAPGDTCIVKSGTYTDTDGDGITVYINSSSVAGTVNNPITLKSEVPLGAQIKVPSLNAGTHGINIGQPYYVIEGFDINSIGVTQVAGANDATAGIVVNASNTTIRKNYLNNISRTLCSDSAFSHQGISTANGITNVLIERNAFYKIGRLLNGESGCSTIRWQHDHGIYSKGTSFLTIRYNTFAQVDRGFVIQLFTTGATHDHVAILNNTIDGGSPDTRLSGTLVLCNTLSNIDIKNNAFRNQAHGYAVSWCSGTTATNMFVRNNASNTQDETGTVDFLNPSSLPAGITVSGTLANATLGLKNTTLGSEDFTLTASSALINAGIDVGLPYNGAAPDIGAFETFTFSACVITAATKIQATYVNNASAPILPASGLTTFTARKNGSANTVSSATRVGDSIIELTTSSSYVGGDTGDISWASGNITDSALIGGTLNQPLLQTLSNQSCTNTISGTTYLFNQPNYVAYGVYGPETTTDVRLGEMASLYEVVKGGAGRFRFAITCSVANCPSTGFLLYYSTNGISYNLVPDAFGADHIKLCGNQFSGLGVAHGEFTTNRLSTSGTFIPGAVILQANAIPTISGLNVGFKTELEACVAWENTATGSYFLRWQEQSGTVFGGSYVVPQIAITSPRAR